MGIQICNVQKTAMADRVSTQNPWMSYNLFKSIFEHLQNLSKSSRQNDGEFITQILITDKLSRIGCDYN